MAKKKSPGKKKWMQKLDLKEGALHRDLGVPEGEKIPREKIEKAAKGKGKTAARARLALVFAKTRRKAQAKRRKKK